MDEDVEAAGGRGGDENREALSVPGCDTHTRNRSTGRQLSCTGRWRPGSEFVSLQKIVIIMFKSTLCWMEGTLVANDCVVFRCPKLGCLSVLRLQKPFFRKKKENGNFFLNPFFVIAK